MLTSPASGQPCTAPSSSGQDYPFPKPHREVPIIIGEW
uniref:Uncharacterized protein n=1 Tax=Arundo donax TaxID=35708 RepID=A0A0A9C2Y1_ARUDO